MLVRFAPSPTGYLHIGNARMAVLNYIFARKYQGNFFLRLDDTDELRSSDSYAQAIQDDLMRLNIIWDQCIKQSDRLNLYNESLNILKRNNRIYPCMETEEELELKRKLQILQKKNPVYDRESLYNKKKEWSGRPVYYRFRLLDDLVSWNDLAKGAIRFHTSNLSDPILTRADGTFLYTLTSVVDDGISGITHIIRGEDHISNTAVQIQLFQALGYRVPDFAHMPLLTGKDGKLSKRTSDLALRDLHAIEPWAIILYLAYLGTSESASGTETLEDVCAFFDFKQYGKSQPMFDKSELLRINQKVLMHMPFDSVKKRLSVDISEFFWESIRGNVSFFSDIENWFQICYQEEFRGSYIDEDRFFLQNAGQLLPETPTYNSYQPWIESCQKIDGRRGQKLFLPLRRALTGKDSGPELIDLIVLMGGRAKKRLLLC